MPRNPPWTRDELILALDLYRRVNPVQANAEDKAVLELSAVLKALPAQGHAEDVARYRNPNGVRMKLANFLALDPSYSGVGLSRGGKLDADIWREFAGRGTELHRLAAAIREGAKEIAPADPDAGVVDAEDEEFPEGRVLTTLHKRRERSPKLVKRKKAAVLKERGRLDCEVCGFDFAKVYGELGRGFAECHHTVPLAELGTARRTKLSDLSIVCANCHRMIHRSKPMLRPSELQASIRRGGSRPG